MVGKKPVNNQPVKKSDPLPPKEKPKSDGGFRHGGSIFLPKLLKLVYFRVKSMKISSKTLIKN